MSAYEVLTGARKYNLAWNMTTILQRCSEAVLTYPNSLITPPSKLLYLRCIVYMLIAQMKAVALRKMTCYFLLTLVIVLI